MEFFFFLFSGITVLSTIAVISARNPVHSVLYLILAFVNSAGLFVLVGAEFLAMILLIVYVGAVAVLFLFVVMMLNLSLDNLKSQAKKYMFSGLIVGGVLLLELIFSFANLDIVFNKNVSLDKVSITNTHSLGKVIYTEFFFIFQMSGCILLVAMIGAIVLTLRRREGVLRQDINKQLSRNKANSIELVKLEK